MPEELNTQEAGTGGAAAPQGAGNSQETAPSGSVSQGAGTSESPEIQQMIKEAIAQVRSEYEDKGGHMAKLKSKYDTKIAELERQLKGQQSAQYKEAMTLLQQGDHENAAQILAQQVQQLQGSVMQEQQRSEVAGWVQKIMTDLGEDLEGDEEAAEFASGWIDRLVGDPDMSFDFHQMAAMRAVDREKKQAENATKELQKLKDGLEDQIKAQVTRTLAEAGLAPEPTGEGGGSQRDDWRDLPSGKLIARGLAERSKTPIQRNP